MFYNGLPKEEIMQIYSFAMKKRKEGGYGQRRLYFLIKEEFKVKINESTISGWIFRGTAPFNQERTQFKAKPKPKKEELHDLYFNKKMSAEDIGRRYCVTSNTIKKWLIEYGYKTRDLTEAMNCVLTKEKLRNKRLIRPTKRFSELTPEKAYILGVLCGDGHINPKFIRFEIRKDTEFIEKFSGYFKEVYGIEYKYNYYPLRNSYVFYAASQIICHDLLACGNFGTFSWRVPKEILNCNNEKIIGNFLQGIYDSEGSATKSAIVLTSVNLKGLKEISLLLFKLGIQNKIRPIRNGKYSILYIFRKQRFKIFKDKIGFTIKRKQEALNHIIE